MRRSLIAVKLLFGPLVVLAVIVGVGGLAPSQGWAGANSPGGNPTEAGVNSRPPTVECEVTADSLPVVTYYEQVSRILEANCVTCHRQGGIGPFPLDTYDRVVPVKTRIERAIRESRMPPWFANPSFGRWANDRSLDPGSRDLLLEWLECGAPAGDPAKAAPQKEWSQGWNIGEPDLVLQIPVTFEVPAEGMIPYQYVTVPTGFTETRWVEAVEVRPTGHEVAHHVVVDLQIRDPANPTGAPITPAAARGYFGYFAVMVPGSTGRRFAPGQAKRLPPGAEFVFQLHYTAAGRVVQDRSMIGLVFAKEPPAEEIETLSVFSTDFAIPPGAERYEVIGEYTFKQDGRLLNFMPHAHMRAVAFRYELVRPDGTVEILLDVPRYDMHWQLDYTLAEPIAVAQGELLRARAWYDNSAGNPHNPDPAATVRWGEQSWEEMMIGYFDWIPSVPRDGDAQ